MLEVTRPQNNARVPEREFPKVTRIKERNAAREAANQVWQSAHTRSNELKDRAREAQGRGNRQQALLYLNDAAISEERAYELSEGIASAETRVSLGFNASLDYYYSGQGEEAHRMSSQVLGTISKENHPEKFSLLIQIKQNTTKHLPPSPEQ